MPPFRVTFPTEPASATATMEGPSASGADCTGAGTPHGAAGAEASASVAVAHGVGPGPGELLVESYVPPDPGPYPQDQPRRNAVRFTPVQVRLKMPFLQHGKAGRSEGKEYD